MTAVQRKMKLGACYNLFDCEELLETSILSIKPNVDYICVVYQTISNFGNPCNPHLEEFLFDLKERGLVNDLLKYEPRTFSPQEKRQLVSPLARLQELGGSPETVADQFMNEVTKRELGRQMCLAAGCTHFMSMDADEYYLEKELAYAKEKILQNDYDATACRMRIFFKEAIYEYFPYDNVNAVPLIYKCTPDRPFKLAHPYNAILDPTRRVANTSNFYLFSRTEIEMYHLSFVRKDIRRKLENVSNRSNYGNFHEFLKKWETWTPDQGVLHPHPYIGKLFTEIRVVDNYFNVDLSRQCRVCCKSQNLLRCSRCKQARYCCREHQLEDWPHHKLKCTPPETS
jgi:hypothetical protein